MRRPLLRSGAWVIAITTALALAAGPTAARTLANPDPNALWAWIVDRFPTSSVVNNPGKDSGNSAAAPNYAYHTATGQYLVVFGSVEADSGNVLVSALGSHDTICTPAAWANTSVSEQIDVRCFTSAGSPVDSMFVANWLSASGANGVLAYGLNFSPTDNCGGPSNAYASNGYPIRTCPASNGIARWIITSLGSSHGTVQVTPYAHKPIDSPTTITPGVCDIVAFYPQMNPNPPYGTDEYVDIKCYDLNGTAQIYREHDSWFMRNLGMKGFASGNVAYLFASKPLSSSYSAPSAYSYNSAGGTNKITRSGIGVYTVTLPGMPKGGSAQVSAYMGDPTATPHQCVIAGIARKTLPEKIGVRCFDLAGNLANSKFTLAYAK